MDIEGDSIPLQVRSALLKRLASNKRFCRSVNGFAF